MEFKSCWKCKYSNTKNTDEPCRSCNGFGRWHAKEGVSETPAVGIDPGAPEGDQTNVRRPWPLDGREINENLFKDGPLVESARAVMKQITRLDYAIEGVRSKIGSIGIKFTDKNLSRDEIAFLVGQLNALRVDLFELEEEREAMMKGGEHGNGND